MARTNKRKLTGTQIHEANEFAKSVSGYNDTSPVWKKTVFEVIRMIEVALDHSDLPTVRTIIEEMKKRSAYNDIYNGQTH